MLHINPIFTYLWHEKYESTVMEIITSNSRSFKIKFKIFFNFGCLFEHWNTNGTHSKEFFIHPDFLHQTLLPAKFIAAHFHVGGVNGGVNNNPGSAFQLGVGRNADYDWLILLREVFHYIGATFQHPVINIWKVITDEYNNSFILNNSQANQIL